MVLKILKIAVVAIAALVALSYAFGYSYIFNAIRQTYLRGTSGSSIDDGGYFPSHRILKSQKIPLQKDSLYNKQALTKNLVENLKATKTASFLVIKNGQLLHEEYWNGYTEKTKTNSFSMAKAVTVLLVGKAIEEKKMKSWDQPFSDYFQNYKNVNFGKYLTLGSLASMEAGLNWNEDYKNPFLPNAKAYYGKSLEEAVFLRSLKAQPGSRFEYQSGATQLLGFALRKSLNKTIAQYASEVLWQPLGMEEDATWNIDNFGMEKTFCCINAISRDFAKLGVMMANDGEFNGKQIISKELVHEMKTGTKLSDFAYGKGLWVNDDAAIKHYYFWGLYGQYIIIVPEKQMVIVRTGSYTNQPKDKKGRPEQVAFLVDEAAKTF